MRPIDYDLIDRLQLAEIRRQDNYICPLWDWMKDFRDRFTAQGWWETTKAAVLAQLAEEGGHGLCLMGRYRNRYICDEVSGDIDWR